METQPDGLKYYYGSDGKITKITNHVGLIWTLTYASSKLNIITNPAGKRTSFGYDGSGKLQSIEDVG